MAEWIRRLTTDQEIPGSSPGRVDKKIFLFGSTEFRSLNLSLAKRALYRLSYTPVVFLHIQQQRFRTFLRKIQYCACVLCRGQKFCPTIVSRDCHPHI